MRRSRWIRSTLALAFAATLALALSNDALAVARINTTSTQWNPTHVSISAGQKVKWTATTGNHHLKSYGGGWSIDKTLSLGTSAHHVFSSTGTFKFYCTIHGSISGGVCSGMCGKVHVT